ncbi:PAS domain-containing sensor histidine kinase [Undibacter mobilis]|uniref:histidine kinase n=1 Tax=Undibacter mobilis TaxID=2292256 RepID=A0A371BAH6_9BRAD|nr:PAS domain-containing sensor histidine kinase [Undibacter mobilis]RDV04619.1 PAS domain-containing sensor histidine kinase [Undibacter mobilis]
MSGTNDQHLWLDDPRLADYALAPVPVWLWREDGTRVLWANGPAAAIFDGASSSALAQRAFDADHPAATQIKRLAGTLPGGGTKRLERLRGFGAPLGSALTCFCSRFTLPDRTTAVLVVSTERVARDLSLPERAHRLIADVERPAAVFSADGELIDANMPARQRIADKRDIAALGLDRLARDASRNGRAEGDFPLGYAVMRKLGAGQTIALLLQFTEPKPVLQPPPTNDVVAMPAPVAPKLVAETPRPQPYRFVWQMDAATHFTQGMENFARLLGPETASVLLRSWPEIAQALNIDTDSRIARALAARETWSGIVVEWPMDGSHERVAIEMSGLPTFDRDRRFTGFRGFGICRAGLRDIDTIAAVPAPKPAEPPSANVLAFRPAAEPQPPAPPIVPVAEPPTTADKPALTASEHSNFEELARELNARLKGGGAKPPLPTDEAPDFGEEPLIVPQPAPTAPSRVSATDDGRAILERLPLGILVYRLNNLLYANRAFLDWTGYDSLATLNEAGGLDSLFIEPANGDESGGGHGAKSLNIATVNGQQKPVKGRLFSVPWGQESALVLMIQTGGGAAEAKPNEAAMRRLESEANELRAVLDTATDGVLLLDRAGRVLTANRSAQALFGYDAADFTELSLDDLFAPESRRAMIDYLDRVSGDRGVMPDAGREAIGRFKRGGLVPLYVTMGRIEGGDKYCALLRDLTAWKRTEEDLINARREAERASTAKSEFLAKISHEIRTPLSAILGFSEVMMDERFGAIGNERYKEYLKDIHAAGGHVISLLNDLLDLSKIEAGKLDLTFVSVSLNDIVQECVAMLQQEANRQRVIIRTSLSPNLPPIVADARSVRQIALNILSNSIKFTGAGGQVIVSTAVNDDNEAMLRVRDTGAGMSEQELQMALEPFRQLATTSRWGASGTGLGLPITKALAEANHARFRITSRPEDGTLVEVAFPATRVLAE